MLTPLEARRARIRQALKVPTTAGLIAAATIAYLILALCLTSGCAVLRAETADQRWYAAKSDYALVVNAAASYCEVPTSNLGICSQLVSLDLAARTVIARGDTVLRAPTTQERNERLLELAVDLARYTLSMRGLLPPPSEGAPAS